MVDHTHGGDDIDNVVFSSIVGTGPVWRRTIFREGTKPS